MIISRKSWHFRVYRWFVEGRLPQIINLCSYCRAVMFWAPLKAIFYIPAVKLYRKGKLPFYSLTLLLIAGITAIIALYIHEWTWLAVFYWLYAIAMAVRFNKSLKKVVVSDWREAEETKFVQYTEKTGQIIGTGIGTGLKYSVGLPLKTIFWTIWVKMWDFHPALFWSILTIAVAAIFYGFYLINVNLWWQVLAGIAAFVLLIWLIWLLVSFLEGKKVNLKDTLVWQFLKAQKQKICPFIEIRD